MSQVVSQQQEECTEIDGIVQVDCMCMLFKMQSTDCSPDQSFGLLTHVCAHSNLQCPSLPFQTTPHHYTCANCKCLVCKTSAMQCSSWGNGTKVRDNVNDSAAAPWHGSTPAAAHHLCKDQHLCLGLTCNACLCYAVGPPLQCRQQQPPLAAAPCCKW